MSINLNLKSTQSVIEGVLTKLAQTIEELFSRSETEAIELEGFERELHGVFAEAERGVMADKLAQYDVDVPKLVINGKHYRRVLRAATTYTCAAGEVQVRRSLYRHQAESAMVPLEQNAGIVAGHWTPLAARQMLVVTSQLPPAAGEALFDELGMMRPSKSSLDRLPKALSAVWEGRRQPFEQQLREAETIPEEAVTVAVSLDGVMTPMKAGQRQAKREQTQAEGKRTRGPAGYQEVGCGTISFYDAQGKRLQTRQLARMPEPKKKSLKCQLQAEMDHILRQQGDLRIVTVADGAKDNWTYLSTAFPNATAVVDFYHAADHLKEALDNAYGENTPQAKAQFDKLRRRLLDESDGVEAVIRSLRHLRQKHPGRKVIARELAYFRQYRHRMRYADWKAQQLPIGSGVVEAACKTLVTQRLKGSGMRWSHRGGQAILTFRALLQSERFERAWSKLASTYVAPIRPSAAVIPFPQSPRTTSSESAI
ncbi:MAG TPA: hypothetical protein VN418_02460 [Gammaproteobacteria bacterium]|nr:hypothetical protein [Gammaproteobacteria bacterium]